MDKIVTKIFISVVLMAVLSSSICYANSSSYYDKDAATVFPIENKNIVMKKEVVRIKPVKVAMKSISDPNVTFNLESWKADCEFTFYNKAEHEETVTMGYPDWLNANFNASSLSAADEFWRYFATLPEKTRKNYEEGSFTVGYGYDEIYIRGYRAGKIPYIEDAWNLRDLTVIVAGENLKPQHKAIVDAKTLPGDGAFTWKVKFKPQESKTVNISFTFRGFGDIGFERDIYILRTGALWADKIGEADIFWDISGRDVNMRLTLPRNYSFQNNIVHWHFKEFEPTEDIVISSGQNQEAPIFEIADIYRSKKQYEGSSKLYTQDDLTNSVLEKRFKSYDERYKSNTQKIYVKALRNEIYARHGREFKSLDLLDIFGNCDWYKPTKDYSDDMLNEIEKKNVDFILNYEKQKGWK